MGNKGLSINYISSIGLTMKKTCGGGYLHEVFFLVSISEELKNSMLILKGLTRRGSPSFVAVRSSFDLSMGSMLAISTLWRTFWVGLSSYLPPQYKERDRSFPVPREIMAIGGFPCSLQITLLIFDRTQPTVPSPPQAVKNA